MFALLQLLWNIKSTFLASCSNFFFNFLSKNKVHFTMPSFCNIPIPFIYREPAFLNSWEQSQWTSARSDSALIWPPSSGRFTENWRAPTQNKVNHQFFVLFFSFLPEGGAHLRHRHQTRQWRTWLRSWSSWWRNRWAWRLSRWLSRRCRGSSQWGGLRASGNEPCR